jgi:hypothetical protein
MAAEFGRPEKTIRSACCRFEIPWQPNGGPSTRRRGKPAAPPATRKRPADRAERRRRGGAAKVCREVDVQNAKISQTEHRPIERAKATAQTVTELMAKGMTPLEAMRIAAEAEG